MRRPLLLTAALVAVAGCGHGASPPADADVPAAPDYAWSLPRGFPVPPVPADNPMTPAKVALGRALFYDVALSENGTQACATCHEPARAFTDGRPTAVGSTGIAHRRNSQTLANVAYNTTYTWASPLLQTLEQQAMVPLFGGAPPELANRDIPTLVARLVAQPRYPGLFAAAFPQAGNAAVTLQHMVQALASFERTLISGGSPYDRYAYGGEVDALPPSAQRGLALFQSERLECTHCHVGFNLADGVQHAGTRVPTITFHNTALYNLDGAGAYPITDTGLMQVTEQAADMGRFRAPTLRNIGLTAPYFHDGSAATLDDVIDHYAAGGRTIASGPDAGNGSLSPLKSGFLPGFVLTADERADLKAFFESLTDPAFGSGAMAAP